MALHEQCTGATDEWYTPPHVFDALGCRFGVDVASPGALVTPWIPTKRFIKGGALERDWSDFGFVWMNPPFGARNGLVPWLEKFFEHGNGIALVPDRTSAPWWQRFAPQADLWLFVSEIHRRKWRGWGVASAGNVPACRRCSRCLRTAARVIVWIRRTCKTSSFNELKRNLSWMQI